MIPLGKIGFEYGDCQKQSIAGEIKWLEIQFTQIDGVQLIQFADAEKTWKLGKETSG